MDPHELNRLFDQMSPTSEQEEAILARLQAPRQEEARPMKHMKKTAVIAAAAALLLMACAFAVASALDPRLLTFFQRTPQDTELLAHGVVEVNQSHTYENGWTVEVEQVLVDRYMLIALMDVTAPEGTPFPTDLQTVTLSVKPLPSSEGNGTQNFFQIGGSQLLEDENAGDNRFSFLYYRGPSIASMQAVERPSSVRITPLDLWTASANGPAVDFRGEDWSCTVELPPEDSGRDFPAGQTILVGEEQITVTQLYLSPISCVIRVVGPAHNAFLTSPGGLSSLEEKVSLTLEDGSVVPMYRSYTSSYNPDSGTGVFVLQTQQIIDPDQVESITILEQTFPLH